MNATFKLLRKEQREKEFRKGYREGFRKGLGEGFRKAIVDSTVRKLKIRFGACPENLKKRVATCPRKSTAYLLLDAAYESASLEEFESIVDSCLGRECEVKRESFDVV